MAGLLSESHNNLIQSQYPPGMSKLEEDEVLLENIFTFPRYRGKGIMTSVTIFLADLARKQGFRRVMAYVDIENKASLKGFLRAGFYSYREEKEKRRFFKCTNRFSVCPPAIEEARFLQFLCKLAVRENIKGWLIYANDDRTVGV